jgi:hypothetical protein
MRGQIGALLPRQGGRRTSGRRQGDSRRCDPRGAALRYAAWDWPVGPDPEVQATTDPEKVFAAWTRLPDAPILAECGRAFDAVAADGALVRLALMRLDRLGVAVGPVVAWPGDARAMTGGCVAGGRPDEFGGVSGVGSGGLGSAGVDSGGVSGGGATGVHGTETIAVLVRAGSAAAIDALLDRRAPGSSAPMVFGRGARFELPACLDANPRPTPGTDCARYWMRPPTGARPVLPAAHVILGALALVPYRRSATASGR